MWGLAESARPLSRRARGTGGTLSRSRPRCRKTANAGSANPPPPLGPALLRAGSATTSGAGCIGGLEGSPVASPASTGRRPWGRRSHGAAAAMAAPAPEPSAGACRAPEDTHKHRSHRCRPPRWESTQLHAPTGLPQSIIATVGSPKHVGSPGHMVDHKGRRGTRWRSGRWGRRST